MIDSNNSLPQLPEGWAWTSLGEICLDPQYGWTTSAAVEGLLHLLRTTDITTGGINWDSVPFCKEEPPEKQKYLLKDGDIVISRAGSVGYSHLIKTPKEAVFASYLIRFRPLINEAYVNYFLKSPSYWESISEKSLGIAIPNVNASKLKQILVPLATLPEQHRIVAKIEELFTRLDAGEEALKKVKAQLKVYRQAVLKHAFEGKLTKEWREAHKGEMEPASVLLEYIKGERKKNAKGEYKELPSLDTSDLPELPEGWVWTRLGEIRLDRSRSIIPNKNPSRMFEIYSVPSFHESKPRIVFGKDIGSNKQIVEKDTVLLCKINPRINRVWVVGNYSEWLKIASTEWIPFFKQDGINSKYLCYFMQNDNFRDFLVSNVSGVGGSLMRTNANVIANYPFPIPPFPEQHKIVEEIEHRFSIADKIEKVVEQSLMRAERLRQGILKRAFDGKLVPQDSNDEPAEKLLERIKVEKAKREGGKKAIWRGRKRLNTIQGRLM